MTVTTMHPHVGVRVVGDGQHVQVRGRLDVRSAADVRLLFRDAADSGVGVLLLDLGEAEIGDATGLGVLVELHRRSFRVGRSVQIVAVSERSRRILRRARLERLFGLGPVGVATLTA